MIGPSQDIACIPNQSERFTRLAEPLRPVLLRSALQLTRNEADAEDLVQETYLRAFRFFDTFQTESSIKPWLLQIQKRLFINQLRSRSIRQDSIPMDRSQSSEELDPPSEGRLHELNARDRMMNEELDEDLHGVLLQLPNSSQEILFATIFGDYSYEEVADQMTCPVGTIRSRLSRAKDYLRNRLQDSAKRYGYAYN